MSSFLIIAALGLSWTLCYFLATERRIFNLSGKIHLQEFFHWEWLIWPVWMQGMELSKLHNGDRHVRRIKQFGFWSFVLLIFSFGIVMQFYPKLNIWGLDRMLLNLPLPVVWTGSTDFTRTDKMITASYYLTTLPLQLVLCNRLALKLFPHSQKAYLVEDAILAEPALPDFYRSVTQLDHNTVLVDYSGSPVDSQEFINAKRRLSECLRSEVEVVRGEIWGTVKVIFKSPYRNDPNQWSDAYGNGIIRKNQRYVYALLTGEILKSQERVIKMGICTDIDATLRNYGRGLTQPRWLFVLKSENGLTEKVLKDWFEDFHIELQDRKGEFYYECDGWYEKLDGFLLKWQNNLTPELLQYLSLEVKERDII